MGGRSGAAFLPLPAPPRDSTFHSFTSLCLNNASQQEALKRHPRRQVSPTGRNKWNTEDLTSNLPWACFVVLANQINFEALVEGQWRVGDDAKYCQSLSAGTLGFAESLGNRRGFCVGIKHVLLWIFIHTQEICSLVTSDYIYIYCISCHGIFF